MDQIKIEVDVDRAMDRQFTAIERVNLPYAAVQAANSTAFEVRQRWKVEATKVFDRPTQLTINAAQYKKATKADPVAEVFLRNEAFKGTPPAKYLVHEVEGGARARKGFEALLQNYRAMPAGMFAVTGREARTDAHGNLPASTINQILSQLGARRDQYQNETEASRARRLKRQARKGIGQGNYFALTRQRGKLKPGVYERAKFGASSFVRTILRYVSRTQYQPRYDIFDFARRTWNQVYPFFFVRELRKAVETSKYRGKL
ncbi:hypothetical protein [[Pseudomonas] boreopolis]|uniref:Uncharacterized protein n=1 Tax=Xanthomonas boreopolis TaxID=86183 RepID=A0A919KHX5_9XANT|nr:hypothetical protein GCM10009090_16580 [[Pseudomonas] boreopolis]